MSASLPRAFGNPREPQVRLRCETYLAARAFEVLRERASIEPVRWAFVGLPAVQQPEWQPLGGTTLPLD